MELKDITKEAALISLDATLEDAVRKMINEQANALIAVDEDGKFAGEVNVSDLFDAVVPEYISPDAVLEHFSSEKKFIEEVKKSSGKLVEEFVSKNAEPVLITDSIMDVAASAVAYQHSRIPVVDHSGTPIGIISRRGLKLILAKFLDIEDKK